MPEQAKVDFAVGNHGSLFLFTPLNDAAREHLEENTADDAMWFAKGLVVEHRYAWDLARALESEGFTLK